MQTNLKKILRYFFIKVNWKGTDMKKIMMILSLIIVISFISSFSLIGCKEEASQETVEETTETVEETAEETVEEVTEETSADDGEKLKIMFTNAFYSAPYCAPMIAAAEEKAIELGVDLQILDGKADGQVQLDQVENAITQGVDGILYFPADQESSATAVRRLAESDIPVIIINSRADPSVDDLVGTFIGTDYYAQGEVAGQMALDALGDEGGNVVIIEGAGGTEAQKKRTDGFVSITSANENIVILAQQQADWDPAKAQTVMEDFISQFGDEIDLVYTQDDGMYQGAAQALKDADMIDKLICISIGANAAGIEAVKNGELYGTASQSPINEGKMGVEYIIKLINGETLPDWVKVESVPVTSENVAEFDGQGW
jgi:ribose transport system substrate-binding protein